MNKSRTFGGLAAIVLAATAILEPRNCEEKPKIQETAGRIYVIADPYKVGQFYAKQYRLPSEITTGTITVETKGRHFDKKGRVITGKAGEKGIMQITEGLVKDVNKAIDSKELEAGKIKWNDVINSPGENIRTGVLAHKLLWERLANAGSGIGDRAPNTVMSYNAGWPTIIPRAINNEGSFRRVLESFDAGRRRNYLRYVAEVIGYGRVLESDITSPLTEELQITSEMGWRTDPFIGENRMHEGIDIKAGKGTKILSPDNLVVEDQGISNSRGRYVDLRSRTINGFYLRYSFNHCSSIESRNGSNAKRGDVIARVGSTGRTTGPHLHFEVSSVYDPRGGNKKVYHLDPKRILGIRKPKPIRFSFGRNDAVDFARFSYNAGKRGADYKNCNEAYANFDNVIQTGILTTLADDAALLAGNCFSQIGRNKDALNVYRRGLDFDGDMNEKLTEAISKIKN